MPESAKIVFGVGTALCVYMGVLLSAQTAYKYPDAVRGKCGEFYVRAGAAALIFTFALVFSRFV